MEKRSPIERRVKCNKGPYAGLLGTITGYIGCCYNVRLDNGENISGAKHGFTIIRVRLPKEKK